MDVLTSANLRAWALQAAVVILVAAPLPRLLGLWSPRVRMAYWRVLLLACLLLPLLQPWVARPEPTPAAAIEVAAATTVVGATTDALPAPIVPAAAAPSSGWRWPLPFGAMEVLIAGVVLRLGWLGLGVVTVGRLRRSARPLWPRPGSIDRAASLVETDAEFLVSATTSRPVTWGLLWPVVLVPRNFETFPEHEQTAIACHELLHVSRADWVRNAGDEFVRAVFWFHPAIWWLINQIQLAREQVVDREAVRRLGARQPYLEALLRMARPAPRLILTPASLFLKKAHLRQRVTLLVKEASMSRARLVASFAIMAFVVFIGGRLVTSAFPLQQSGARTPGVQTAAPKLAGAGAPVSVDLQDAKLRNVLSVVSQMAGITITYTGVPDRTLDQVVTVRMKEARFEDVLNFVLKSSGLTYTVTSERSVMVRPSGNGGVSGGVAGSAKPGVSTGTGQGVGVGGGSGPGVAGGVSGGVPGGVVGGVSSGVAGGLAGSVSITGVLDGVRGGVSGGVAGGASGGIGGIQGGIAGGPGNFGVVRRVDPSAPGLTGRGIVAVLIAADGSVSDASPFGPRGVAYDVAPAQAAVDAARHWLFEPAGADGRTTFLAFNLTAQNTSGAIDAPLVRIGGSVPPPKKLVDVKPIYPKEAQESRIQGVQILEVSIDPSGDVLDVRALRGQQGLITAALDAVLQWKFTEWPGPERRLMTVTVNFTLDNSAGTAGLATPVRDNPGAASAQYAAQYAATADWPAAIRVGGNIKPPTKTVDVKPIYPPDALTARVQGVVICEAVIGPDGKVADVRILRSIPLLDRAAIDAVRQWEFTPTLLNGTPVPVIMTMTVNFTLE